jgi:alanyl aminopeptidase
VNVRRLTVLRNSVAVALVTFATVAASAAAGARLERKVVPTFQSVRLTLDPAKPIYSGTTHIDLSAREATSSFDFHARGITIERLVLARAAEGKPAGGDATGGDRGIPARHATEGDQVLVTTERPIDKGAYTLDIGFSVTFDTQATGLYRLQVEGNWYSFTQFEATDARGAFPCWDEPDFKIPFQMTLVVPKGDMAIGNTPIVRETAEGDHRIVEFEKTPPLPTYLLAIATGPLETVAMQGLKFPGRIVTVKGSAGLAQEAARVTPPLTLALEKYFGTPYPYKKLDVLAVPEFWPGAMENAGAITFADRILLIDPRAASVDQRRTLVVIVAHEVAHMWFGDLVTMTWWDDLWLNESFASWMGDKVSDQVFPEFKAELAQVTGMNDAMTTDARLSTRAMRQPVVGVENLDQLADTLAYDKGQAVLTMFERWLGPETFRKGVIEYLKAHEWGNATASDLWASLSKASAKDIGAAMGTFLDQPGVPLVKAEILADGRVRLAQSRFLNYGVAPPKASMWRIPVTLKFPDGGTIRTETLLLKDQTTTVTLGAKKRPAWIHPNAGETGYYRWQVPPAMLQALATDARTALTPRERVGFLGNLAALLDGGALKGDDYMKLLGRFATDPEPRVVGGVLDGLEKVKEAFVVPDLQGPFVAWLRATLSPALARIGRARVEGEDAMVTSLRPRLLEWLGKEGRDESVLDQAASLATAFAKDPASIDPAVAGIALQLSAQRGDRALFKEYCARFESARVPADRGRYLAAIGSFEKPELVDAALAYALAGPLRPQELLSIPRALYATPASRPAVWSWVRTNFKTIASRVPPNYVAYLVYFAAGCSTAPLEEAKTFFATPDHDINGVSVELAKVADQVNDCAALRRREQQTVAGFLRAPGPGSAAAGTR